MDSVVDGNETYFADGFFASGANIYGSWQCDWYISYVGNKMRAGTYYGLFGSFGPNDIYRNHLQINGVAAVKVNIAMTIRRNECYDLSNLRFCFTEGINAGYGLVIEDNYMKDSIKGIDFCGLPTVQSTVLAGNRFEDCDVDIVYPSNTAEYIEID